MRFKVIIRPPIQSIAIAGRAMAETAVHYRNKGPVNDRSSRVVNTSAGQGSQPAAAVISIDPCEAGFASTVARRSFAWIKSFPVSRRGTKCQERNRIGIESPIGRSAARLAVTVCLCVD
jgi:hypothetical protein